MQLWMGFSKFLNFPQVPNVSNEVGPWFSLETWSSTTDATYSSNPNCLVPLWALWRWPCEWRIFPACYMYQLLLTKKRKGSNFCVKEELQQYSNSSSHSSTSLVCGPVATHKAGGIVYFEGKEEGYLLFNSMGRILSLFMGVRPLPLFKE